MALLISHFGFESNALHHRARELSGLGCVANGARFFRSKQTHHLDGEELCIGQALRLRRVNTPPSPAQAGSNRFASKKPSQKTISLSIPSPFGFYVNCTKLEAAWSLKRIVGVSRRYLSPPNRLVGGVKFNRFDGAYF